MLTSSQEDERELIREIATSNSDPGILDEASDGDDSSEPRASSPLLYEINSYGADYPIDGLVKRLDSNDIYVPPFQRKFVWTQSEASRFIESLLFGFPVPAIFLSKETSGRYLIVDGQQRLKSLQSFYNGNFFERKFRLTGVNDAFQGKTYEDLAAEHRRRLDNAIMHAIIVQQDEPRDDGESSIYLIFERLNSGGRPLFPQEIRTCVDHGPFIELLHALNQDETWRKLYGPYSKRLKDEELILRFFALHDNASEYASPMKVFLNRFSHQHRALDARRAEELSTLFSGTASSVYALLGETAFRPIKAFNAAVYDAIMVATARRLRLGPVKDITAFKQSFDELIADADFINAYSKATATEESVRARIQLATDAFLEIP